MPRLIDAEKLAEYKASGISELTEWQKGWNDAIDTIMDEEPTVNAIPIEWIKEWVNNYCDWSQEKLIEILLRTWSKKNAPTVETESVRHGHWIFNAKDAIEMMFTLPKCSECGALSPDGGNYCPNCGVKMDKRKEYE